MNTIPLFPLNTVLFPKGKLSLQIFESRYVDLVRRCLKEQSGFGIVLIREGSEVAAGARRLRLYGVGTYCEIVDWNELASGLLGISVEGKKTFQVDDYWRERNELCCGEVAFREQDGVDADPVPVEGIFSDYVELLRTLAGHPVIEELKLEIAFDDLREIAWRLAELLPVSNPDKQALLEFPDPLTRLQQIDLLIRDINQQPS